MKKVTIWVIVILALLGVLIQPSRAKWFFVGGLTTCDPNHIPFTVDPNQKPLMGWFELNTGQTFEVELDWQCLDANTPVLWEIITAPAGFSLLTNPWRMRMTANTPGIYYTRLGISRVDSHFQNQAVYVFRVYGIQDANLPQPRPICGG